MTSLHIEPIAIVHSCFTEKFGIPRQPGLVESSVAEIELLPPYNRIEVIAGIEEFSHIWIHFQFHTAVDQGWRESVRPPGLGGKKRVGVLATRSPHRPNHIGLSVVKLLGIRSKNGRLFLDVSGVDLLDKTPVLDIKPYVAYSDSVPDARSSYAGKFNPITVEIENDPLLFCAKYKRETDRDIEQLIHEVLSQDPRPASQRGKRHDFGVMLWDVNVKFTVKEIEGNELFSVTQCDIVEE